MSKTPPFAPETLETIQRAICAASERRHDVTEHLLLAATDEPQARRGPTSCGADVETLRRQLTEVLMKAFEPCPGREDRARADDGLRPRGFSRR
jgi:hypothetical protein